MIAAHTFVSFDGMLTPPIEFWALSFAYARKHIAPVTLFANQRGHDLLADIPYDNRVVIPDDEIPTEWAKMPTLAKLLCYRYVKEPFVHIDSDGFQTKPLRQTVLDAPWFCLSEGSPQSNPSCGCGAFAGKHFDDEQIVEAFAIRPHVHCGFGICGGTAWQSWNNAAARAILGVSEVAMRYPQMMRYTGWAFEEGFMQSCLRREHGRPESVAATWRECDIKLSGHIHLIAGKWQPAVRQKVSQRLKLVAPALANAVELFNTGPIAGEWLFED